MARFPITVMGYRCERCDHGWIPHNYETGPEICLACKSPDKIKIQTIAFPDPTCSFHARSFVVHPKPGFTENPQLPD